MKPMLIVFEGLDKTGKTTLIRQFNKLTKHRYWVLDRCIISSIVYDKLFSRNRDLTQDREKTLEILIKEFDLRVVYCMAENEVIEKRLRESNEVLPPELADLYKVKDTFLSILSKHRVHFICVDTNNSIDNCLREIKEFIER